MANATRTNRGDKIFAAFLQSLSGRRATETGEQHDPTTRDHH
jgi:hypothetical protein